MKNKELASFGQMLANPGNYNQLTRKATDIKYIAVHYTGNVNDTARSNCVYYQTHVVKASAHLFVDKHMTMLSVPYLHTAYSLGDKKYASCPDTGGGSYFGRAKNSNSISVEICGGKKTQVPEQETLKRAAHVVALLMDEYDVPMNNLIRHFDVIGKLCPAWAMPANSRPNNTYSQLYKDFRNLVIAELEDIQMSYDKFTEYMARYESEQALKDPAWAKEVMQWGIDNGIIKERRPMSSANRAEILTMLKACFDKFNAR